LEFARQHAREFGVHEPAYDLPMTDNYRPSVCENLAKDPKSLRENKGADGEAFFAEMYAEFDALQQQGRE
jgi:hypothetical protein